VLDMMKSIILFFALLLCIPSLSTAQDWNAGGGRRLDRFRKMRLIEVLKLSEDDAVRFFAKQSAHEQNVQELMKSRNEAIDEVDSIIRNQDDGKKIAPLADRLMDIDRKLFEERQRFQNDVRQLLTPEQFGKFLVFERNFGRQVRDALEEIHQSRPSPR